MPATTTATANCPARRKVIGGQTVTQRIDPKFWEEFGQFVPERLRIAITEVVDSAGTLSLDNPRDRVVLVERLRHCLGLP